MAVCLFASIGRACFEWVWGILCFLGEASARAENWAEGQLACADLSMETLVCWLFTVVYGAIRGLGALTRCGTHH